MRCEISPRKYILQLFKVCAVIFLATTLFVTMERRDGLFKALRGEGMYRHARAEEAAWVDVKDLLEGSKVVIERTALETLFEEHESDLPERQKLRSQMPELYVEVDADGQGALA